MGIQVRHGCTLICRLWFYFSLRDLFLLLRLRLPTNEKSCSSIVSFMYMCDAQCKLPSVWNCAWSCLIWTLQGHCIPPAFAMPFCSPQILCQLQTSVTRQASVSIYVHARCISASTGWDNSLALAGPGTASDTTNSASFTGACSWQMVV